MNTTKSRSLVPRKDAAESQFPPPALIEYEDANAAPPGAGSNGGARAGCAPADGVILKAGKSRAKAAGAAAAEAGEEDGDSPEYVALSAGDFLVKAIARELEDGRPLTGDWREVFLRALARAPILSVAARVAGVPRARAVEERMANAEFARRWDDALEEGADEVEAAAFRSAVYGEEKAVYHQGKVKGWTVDYSHAMRSILLKCWRPAIFGDKEEMKDQGAAGITLDEFRKRVEEGRR